MHSQYQRNQNCSIGKFESMLKTKELKFFDLCEFEEIVNHYIDISDFTKTKKAIDLGLNQHPNSCELLILKAEHYILTNHYESAALIIDDLMVVHPENEIIYQHKAAILSKKNLHQDAIETLKKGMRFCHNYSEFNSLIALEYLYIEEYFMAKEYFIKCLNKDDRDNHSLYNIIYCFESMNDNLGAISFLNECLNKNPYNEVAWHQIGRQYFEIRMYEQALVSFDYAIICDEKFVGAYFELAKTLEKLGRYNEAISFYEITLSIDDPTSFAFHRIGECHLLLGNDLLGLKYLKKTIHEDPLLEKGWISLCNYYLTKKNYKEAIHYINKALKIDDSNYFFLKIYSKAHKEMGLLEESCVGYSKLYYNNNYDIKICLEWVEVLLKLKDFSKGIEVLSELISKYPNNSKFQYFLAGFYMMISNNDEASFFLKNAYSISPSEIEVFYEVFPSSITNSLVKKTLQF